MKGISTILAMILIVIIVVALIGLTYTFAVGLFTTTTTSTTAQTEATTKRLDKHVSFISDPTCTNTSTTWTVKFTIRHDGATYNINDVGSTGELSVIFAGEIIPDTATKEVGGTETLGKTKITPGSAKTFNFTNTSAVNWANTQTLTISAPAGIMPKTVTCLSLP
jgi:archaellum component FlaF (FlaF/FlaG flagellin family)